MHKRVLFISMLGEDEVFAPANFTSLCQTGLERDWVLDWHGPSASKNGLLFEGVDICRGDKLPAPEEVSGVLLGGTMHVVTEDRPWLHDLRHWLSIYRGTPRPLLAICGGHQMLSTQFGAGELTGRDDGTLAGTYNVTLTEAGQSHPLFSGLPENPRFHFANYLHVLPSNDQLGGILAIQSGSPAIAIDHGGRWFSCQFHPEARKDSWDTYYGALDPTYESEYETDHDGPALISNFFRIAAHADTR